MKRSIVVLAAVCLLSGMLAAKELTWESVLQEAKANNPTLKRAGELVNQAQETYRRSYTNFLPQLSASAGTSRGGSDTTGVSTDSSVGLSGSLSLFSGFSDMSELSVRDFELKAARAQYRRIYADTVHSLKKGFIDLLWAQETVSLLEKILKRREENLKLVRLKYEAGREDRGSLLRIEADRLQAEYELAKSKRFLKTAADALQRAMGLEKPAPVSASGGLAAAKPENISFERALAQTPEYLIASYSVKKAAAGITAARSGFYPQFSLSGSAGRSGANADFDHSRWSVGLNLSYPFFPGGRNLFDVKIAGIAERIARASLRETELQLATSIETAYNALIDAVENVGVTGKYLEASQEQSRITNQKYINGLASYQDWYTIENDFINVQKSALNAKRTAALAEASWKNILGDQE